MRVKTIQRFRGKEEKKYFEENEEFTTSKERGKKLIELRLVDEVKEEDTELTLKQLAAEVEKASAEELDTLEEAESKGSNRAGAKKLFEKRRADLAEAEE